MPVRPPGLCSAALGRVATFILVCVGGAVGTGARFLVVNGLARWMGPAFPFGTLTVNVVGSFLLGAILELGLARGAIPPHVRVVLATGVMGGFTTYSSFNYELTGYVQRGAWALGAVYLGATLLGSFAAGLLGILAARWATGA